MDKINWSKEMALELIQAGYVRMAKKLHPDVGGTQEQMLVLQETKNHLEQILAGRASADTYRHQTDSSSYARSEPRTEWRTRWRNPPPPPKDDFTGDVPLEPYPDDSDYVQLKDVTIMSLTEKAIRIKIPGVKVGQWLPKSQMLADHFDYAEGDVITVVFTKWIAKQKGWIK